MERKYLTVLIANEGAHLITFKSQHFFVYKHPVAMWGWHIYSSSGIFWMWRQC